MNNSYSKQSFNWPTFTGLLPNPFARLTGLIYLFYFITAISSLFFHKGTNGYIGINLVSSTLYLLLVVFFFYLFKPVNKIVSVIATLVGTAGCLLTILNLLNILPFHLDPLVFFGPFCILIGYLIYKSVFLPKISGILMVFAGFCWLMVFMPFAKPLLRYIEISGFLAELFLMIWLIAKGADAEKWNRLYNP